MRCCMELLICIAVLYVSHVKPDRIELNEFFKTLQHHDDILSKKVFVGGRETSINDFFNVRSAKGIKVEDSWPITKTNLNEASYLLNIVMSCEYSDFIHGYIDFVNRSVEKCIALLKQPESTRKCYTDMVSISYKLITENLSGMIFVLTWLQKQSKNVLSKKRDVLKIMLSLYAWMYRDIVTEVSAKENILAKLKSVKTKTLQIRFYLKRFDIINCDPPVAVVGVNHGTGSVTETPYVMSVKKVPIMHGTLGTTSTFFVFSPTDAFNDNIIAFIDSFNSDRTFEKNSVFRVKLAEINYRLKSVSDVGEIVDYEMLLLQFITKTIESIVTAKLQQIMKVSGLTNTDRHGQCVVSLQKVIRDYIIRFKADGQPSYLIDRMILIEQNVWLICYKMKSTDVTVQNSVNKCIESWRLSAGNLKTDKNRTDLKSALEMLSKYPICSILHPSISNVHLGQAYYYDSDIFRYMVDFKHIHQKLIVLEENSNTLCSQILGLRKIVEFILPYIDNCDNFIDETESADSVSNSCFIVINDKCEQLRDSVSVIIKNFFPNEVTDWQKMYLLLNFNMSNVIMYHSKSSNLKGSMNRQRKQNFHRLFLDMDNFLKVQYHIYCGYKDTFLFKDLEYEKKSTSLSSANNGNENKVNSSAAANVDTSTHTYHEYFQYFIKFTDHVANHHDLDEKLRLYWDGGQQSIREANISLKKYTFDLQDGYYSQDFIVKWILSVAYTRIRDVIDVMLSYGYKLKDSDLEALNECLKPVYGNLPLFLFQVTKYVFERFLLVVTDFSDDNLDELKHFRTLLESQLEFIGIVPDSVPNVLHSQNVSERINSLKTTIELLVMIYNDFNFNYHSNIDNVLITIWSTEKN